MQHKRSMQRIERAEEKRKGVVISDFTDRSERESAGESEPLTLWENILGWSVILGIVFWFNRRKLVPWILEKTKDIRRF